ncbi:MAG: hypothetical protein AAF821_18190 [Cyanobacteria bacterium P01_D01_bin.156]
MSLQDWFQYADKDTSPYNPSVGTNITVNRFWHHEEGNFDTPDWKKEEWLVRSALVPIDQLESAASQIKEPDDLTFETGWDFENQFDFGDHMEYGNLQLYPLVLSGKHPITEEITVELCRKFRTYHALETQDQLKYNHPIDKLIAATVLMEAHPLYDPTAKVTVHPDYLRDFLAAVQMGLIISVVADRFANALTEDALQLEEVEAQEVDAFTTLSTIIHPPEFTRHEHFRGRSILHRNFIIEPYTQPKFERSPWHFYGEKSAEDSTAPTFIINDEGEKKPLPSNTFLPNYTAEGIGQYGYLYFRPEVLHKYLNEPGYSVCFHMRKWGTASIPGGIKTVDVGINSHGLVNAFAPDIADLSITEQSYWASYSSLPNGEICDEMFQTRMQQKPPHSPGVIEVIQNARSQLSDTFKNQFSVDLFKDKEPPKKEQYQLSVGPILGQMKEVTDFAKTLYIWAIEPMEIDALRAALTSLGGTVDKKLRQIKLLEKILIQKGLNLQQARSITAALVGLNDLRIVSAHIGGPESKASFQLMGATSMPETPIAAWDLCVDAVAASLRAIEQKLRA